MDLYFWKGEKENGKKVDIKRARDAVLTIDKLIQEHLYSMHSKTVDKWNDTKREVDKIVERETGKSVYGYWE